MEPFYRKIYSQSWHLAKKNLHLLFFGLFASLLGFNEIKLLFDFQNPGPSFLSASINSWWQTLLALISTQINLANWAAFVALLGLFIIFAAVIILVISSQGALMYSAAVARSGKNGLRLSTSLQVGLEKFWALFGINLLNLFVGYYFLVFIIQPLIQLVAIQDGVPYFLLLSIIIFFIIIPLIIAISFATRYGIGYIIVYKQPILTAFNNGWNLFKINWLITIESAIAITATTIAFFIAMLAIVFMVFAPFLVVAFVLSGTGNLVWLLIALGSLAAIIIVIFMTSFYGVYYNLLWSNIFLRLTSRTRSYSKIHRFAHKHVPHFTK